MSHNETILRTTQAVAPSLARTSTSASNAVGVGQLDSIVVLADVTAVSGTSPSLALEVQWSDDGTTWFSGEPQDTFTAITAAKKVAKSFVVKGLYFRVSYAITGTTPSFTFALDALVGS